jgi:hypothetical protein
MKRTVVAAIIMVVILTGLTGCAVMEQIQQRLAVKNCEFHLANARTHSFSLSDMLVDLDIVVTNPNPMALKNNIKRLKDKEVDFYRLRVGSYRMIFQKK